jgi:hypothetical protein
VPKYVFGVNIVGTVHVQAADEFEARKLVPPCCYCLVLMRSEWLTTAMPRSDGQDSSPRSTSV